MQVRRHPLVQMIGDLSWLLPPPSKDRVDSRRFSRKGVWQMLRARTRSERRRTGDSGWRRWVIDHRKVRTCQRPIAVARERHPKS